MPCSFEGVWSREVERFVLTSRVDEGSTGFGLSGVVTYRPQSGGDWTVARVDRWNAISLTAEPADRLADGTYTVRVETEAPPPVGESTCKASVDVGPAPPVPPPLLVPEVVAPGGWIEAHSVIHDWNAGTDRVKLEAVLDGQIYEDLRAEDRGPNALGHHVLGIEIPDEQPSGEYRVTIGGQMAVPLLTVLAVDLPDPPGLGGGPLECDVEVQVLGFTCKSPSKDQGGDENEIRLRVFTVHSGLDGSGGRPIEKKRPDRNQDVYRMHKGDQVGQDLMTVGPGAERDTHGFTWPWTVFTGRLQSLRDLVTVAPVVWERDSSGDDDDHPDVTAPRWERLNELLAPDAQTTLNCLREASLPSLELRQPTPAGVLFNGVENPASLVLMSLLRKTELQYVFSKSWERHRPIGQFSLDQGDTFTVTPMPIVLTAETALALANSGKGLLSVSYSDTHDDPAGHFTVWLKVTAKPVERLVEPEEPEEPTVRHLEFEFKTGDDDLRGGNDNVNIVVHLTDRDHQVDNINNGARFPDHTTKQATVDLPADVHFDDISAVTIETTFEGGVGGDNWNMDRVAIQAVLSSGPPKNLATHGHKRFTGDDKRLRLPAR